jgi:hypothetical protein
MPDQPQRPALPWKPARTRVGTDEERVHDARQDMTLDPWTQASATALAASLANHEEAWSHYLDVEEYMPEYDRRVRLVLELLAPTGLVGILGALCLLRHNLTETLSPKASPEVQRAQEDRDEAAYDLLEKRLKHLADFLGMR